MGLAIREIRPRFTDSGRFVRGYVEVGRYRYIPASTDQAGRTVRDYVARGPLPASGQEPPATIVNRLPDPADAEQFRSWWQQRVQAAEEADQARRAAAARFAVMQAADALKTVPSDADLPDDFNAVELRKAVSELVKQAARLNVIAATPVRAAPRRKRRSAP